jgi:hypothetical protein
MGLALKNVRNLECHSDMQATRFINLEKMFNVERLYSAWQLTPISLYSEDPSCQVVASIEAEGLTLTIVWLGRAAVAQSCAQAPSRV